MATSMMVLLLVMLALVLAPWVGSMNVKRRLHPTDSMAGDEGEDDPSIFFRTR